MTSASDEKWRPFNCFFSRAGLRTYHHLCISSKFHDLVTTRSHTASICGLWSFMRVTGKIPKSQTHAEQNTITNSLMYHAYMFFEAVDMYIDIMGPFEEKRSCSIEAVQT